MTKSIYELTKDDIRAIQLSSNDPNIFFAHFFHKDGLERPFQLDYKFDKDAAWQKSFCMAKEHFLVAIAGISTGKTLTVAMSAAYLSVKLRSFRFMDITNEQGQADTMREFLLDQIKDTLFEKLVAEKPKTPISKIVIRFSVYGTEYKSELQFRNTGEKKDAKNIKSTRMDWINVDEADLVMELPQVVSTLVTRLTGNTAEGRPYLGRLSLTANPTDDNPALWEMRDRAEEDEDGRVFNISTKDNKNTTDSQVKFAVSLLGDEDDVEMWMTGNKPKSTGKYFSSDSIDGCMSIQLQEQLDKCIQEGSAPYHKDSRHGLLHWELPYEKEKQYMIFGDPGTKNAPKRDAPVLAVFNVTNAPIIAPMDALWWGNGHGNIGPFNQKLMDFIAKYNPLVAGVDSTATQKQFAQVTSSTLIEGKGYSISGLLPMDFSGGRKYAYLIALRLALELGMIQIPSGATGVATQLRRYDPEKDRGSSTKLPQDVVSAISMAAFWIRQEYRISIETHHNPNVNPELTTRRDGRRYSSTLRSRRTQSR